jgi:predicted nucleic acid-binding protein
VICQEPNSKGKICSRIQRGSRLKSDWPSSFSASAPLCRYPLDDLIFELAVAANAHYILTHNLRDFRGSEKWGIEAVSPSNFLKQIKI